MDLAAIPERWRDATRAKLLELSDQNPAIVDFADKAADLLLAK